MILLAEVPVDPSAPEARQWVLDELSKAGYQRAQPTWFDKLGAAVRDWFESIHIGSASGPPAAAIALFAILALVVIVVVFLVFGLPRINRRSRATGTLFGEDDDRDAATMRRDAERAAAAGDFTLAIAELFRAIARGLAERTVVTVSPGTTARGFADRAARAFPLSGAALVNAAASFDGVRYLSVDGTREDYLALLALDSELRAAQPLLEPIGAP